MSNSALVDYTRLSPTAATPGTTQSTRSPSTTWPATCLVETCGNLLPIPTAKPAPTMASAPMAGWASMWTRATVHGPLRPQ